LWDNDQKGGSMSFICKGKCEKFKSIHTHGFRYEDGEKRCSVCTIFIKIDDIRCPCCSAKLRTKSRISNKLESKKNLIFR